MIGILIRALESVLIMLGCLVRPRPSGAAPLAKAAGSLGTTSEGGPFWLRAREMATHLYLLGATGVGKTTLILSLIERDIKEGLTVAILDLRGDLIRAVLAVCDRLEVQPDRVTLFDLREKVRVQGYSPLAGAGEPYVIALHVLTCLRQMAQSWGVRIEDVLRCALLALVEAGQPLTALESLLYDSSFRAHYLESVSDEAVLSFWARYDEMSEEVKRQWAAPALNKVTPLLAVPHLRRVLSGDAPLNLKTLLDKKSQVLLVSLAVDELHDSGKLVGSLLVGSIAREMMARVNVDQSRRNPVRLYIDEFENMASEAFEGLIAEGRRFNLTLVLSHQTLSQLPGRLRSVLRNNVGTQILYQVGAEDAKTIASELPAGIDSATLRSLRVGEAVVMKRDGTAQIVQFNAPGRPWPDESTQAYRKQVLARLAEASGAASEERSELPVEGPDLEEWL